MSKGRSKSSKQPECDKLDELSTSDQSIKDYLITINKCVQQLQETVKHLSNEVQILRESNIDLIKLLTSNSNIIKEKKDVISENLDEVVFANTSLESTSSVNTVVEKRVTLKKDPKKDSQASTDNNNIQGSIKKNRNKQNINTNKKIIGESSESSNTFAASSPRLWVYVGRCRADTEVKDVETYISTRIPNGNVNVEKLQSKGSNSSFCVRIDSDLKEQIYDPKFWPKNIIVRRYKFFRGNTENMSEL